MDSTRASRPFPFRWRRWLAVLLVLVGVGVGAGAYYRAQVCEWIAHPASVWAALRGGSHTVHVHGNAEHHDDDADDDHDEHDAHGDHEAHGDHDAHDEHGDRDAHDEHDDHDAAPGAAGHSAEVTTGKAVVEDADHAEHAGESHAAGSHGHKHDETAAMKLSSAAQASAGIRLERIEPRPFERTITVPAMVVERPGRSIVKISAPLTGVVMRIWPIEGESIVPGQPLFDLRLTHEELVSDQGDFLRTAEELDVVRREITRLEAVAQNGAVAGKTLLERSYEKQKLEAVLRSQKQRLMLHGLSAEQVEEIQAKRTLFSELTVRVPETAPGAPSDAAPKAMQVQELKVEKGQRVSAGDPLCVLADHSDLYIEGKAFEQDLPALETLTRADGPVTAVFEAEGKNRQMVPGLKILYLANRIEPDSRACSFFVRLPNKLVADRRTADGHRFVDWQFKPGQRAQLLLPVERWTDRLVLPGEAVVQDGAENYVFERNEGHFDRRAVRVEYRDPYSAVIVNDGSITPGSEVVVAGAYQVHLALKNKSGGAPDPHAGHNH